VGSQPDELERSIAQKREDISSRITVVRQRVREDAANLRSSAENQASDVKTKVQGNLNLGNQVESHPLAALTGALGLGIALGAASEGSGDGSKGKPSSHPSDSSSGVMGGLLASLISPTTNVVRDELQGLVSDAFSSFRSNTGIKSDRTV